MHGQSGILLGDSSDQAIRARLADDLADVEARFAAELLSDLPCVNTLVGHVERYRGKMLRPMLVLVTGMAAAPTRPELTDAHRVVATVVEMVHMATLVHDDILDEAEIRRRGATINHLRGNEAAVMLGDYLISHAYHLCSSLPTPVPSRIIADATNIVCEGELLQLANRENWNLDEATYSEIIRRKTASLCGTCCRVGAMLSDATPAVVDAMYAYGEKLGIAFQIVDDVLDLAGDEQTVGKTLGRDLEKGKLTLPLIHHIASLTSRGDGSRPRAAIDRVRAAIAAERDVDAGAFLRSLDQTGSLAYASATASSLVEQAKASLDVLPESSARGLLLTMADAVITRKL